MTNSNYPKTFKEWFKENLADRAKDIAEHGADCGFPNISCTSDTAKIFNQYQDEIWTMINEQAEELGAKDSIDFIDTFNRIDMAYSFDGFKTMLAWFACEMVACELTRDADDSGY